MKILKALFEICAIPVMVAIISVTLMICGLVLIIRALLDRPGPKEKILGKYLDKKLAINASGRLIKLDEIEHRISS